MHTQQTYFPILGQTMQYTQPSINILKPEIVITDNVKPVDVYPFNISADSISNIELKLENTNVTIDNMTITANKPIFIECVSDTLRIWNIKSNPNNSISFKGNIFVDGYNILDFDNNNIKSLYTYNYKKWTLPKMNPIKKIVLNGNSNIVELKEILAQNTNLCIFSENTLKINSEFFTYLNIHTTYSTIYFSNSQCDNLDLKIEGNGNIKNLSVLKYANITNIGSTNIRLNKLSTTLHTETINGIGKIFWNDIFI